MMKLDQTIDSNREKFYKTLLTLAIPIILQNFLSSSVNMVDNLMIGSLGEEAIGTITPHSFRHYFVTTVLQGSGGNLKLAQELARHKNIAVTQRYAHLSDEELDKSYWDIFDEANK